MCTYMQSKDMVIQTAVNNEKSEIWIKITMLLTAEIKLVYDNISNYQTY